MYHVHFLYAHTKRKEGLSSSTGTLHGPCPCLRQQRIVDHGIIHSNVLSHDSSGLPGSW